MIEFTRRNLPADICVLSGDFASQPLVFAHLLDVAPDLDLGQVEVIQTRHATRLGAYFEGDLVDTLATKGQTLVLILPLAYDGDHCLLGATPLLDNLGTFRGTVPHLSAGP